MLVAVIADIHENFHNLILALKMCEERKVEQIICLGDLMNSGIAKVLAMQDIPCFMVWGNNDGEKVEITLASQRPNSQLTISNNVYDFLEIDGRKLFLSHYHDLANPMAKSGTYDAVFFGHTHVPSIDHIGNCLVVNPGEISAAKTGKATFALYDSTDNTAEMLTIENAISLKSELVMDYFKANADKLNLRSSAAMELKIDKD